MQTDRQLHLLTESTEGDDAVPLVISEASGQLIEAAEATGKEWDIILIETGLSKNGRRYPAHVLEASASRFEGAAVFADHPGRAERIDRPERSIRDKVGKLVDVAFGQHDVGGRIVEGLRARFKVIAPWMREMFVEAHAANEPDFVGFSINAMGEMVRTTEGSRPVSEIRSIVKVDSVDVVTDPAAGGQVVRLVAASRGGGGLVPPEVKELLEAAAKAARKIDPKVTDEIIAELTESAHEALGYTVVDSPSVLSTHLTEIIRRYSGELLGRQDVQKLLDNLREHQPAVVESVIPDILNLGQVHRVLQGLLEERVSIRDLPVILESLADHRRQSDDPAAQLLRTALARSITEQYLAEDGAIHAFMLDPHLEEQVASAMRETPSGVLVALPPDTIETVLANIQAAIQQTVTAGGQPILLCAQQVRQGLRNMTHRRIPNLVVLAYTEIAPEAVVTTEGVIRIDQ